MFGISDSDPAVQYLSATAEAMAAAIQQGKALYVGLSSYSADKTAEIAKVLPEGSVPVILISHNLPHVFEIVDRIHIARLGKRATMVNPTKFSMPDTVVVMTGAAVFLGCSDSGYVVA